MDWHPQVLIRKFHHEREFCCADRAYRCGVCREPYSLPPRVLHGRLHVMGSLKALAMTALIALLALGVSGGFSLPASNVSIIRPAACHAKLTLLAITVQTLTALGYPGAVVQGLPD